MTASYILKIPLPQNKSAEHIICAYIKSNFRETKNGSEPSSSIYNIYFTVINEGKGVYVKLLTLVSKWVWFHLCISVRLLW